jgi:hypothetical protein
MHTVSPRSTSAFTASVARVIIPRAHSSHAIHRIAAAYTSGETPKSEYDTALTALTPLDALEDASILNHVARRA